MTPSSTSVLKRLALELSRLHTAPSGERVRLEEDRDARSLLDDVKLLT
jgi:hypothetical protein